MVFGRSIAGRISRRAVLGAGAALLWPASGARATRVFPADGTVEFTARRQARDVGLYRFRFTRRPNRFIVHTDIDLDVRAGDVPLWRHTHHAEEVWDDGWLDSVVADTNDNGRRYLVRAARRAEVFTGTVNGAAFTVSGYIIPASLWHRDTPDSQTLFDTVDGRVKVVRSTYLGSDRVPTGKTTVTAQHYAITGGIVRDVWYDADCALAQISIPGRDGVPVVCTRM